MKINKEKKEKEKEKDYITEATEKAFEDEPMSDESMYNAILAYRRKKKETGEKTSEDAQSVLALSKSLMRENARRKRKKRIVRGISLSAMSLVVVGFVFACILYFRTPIIINDAYWKSMITITMVDYGNLIEHDSQSLHQMNKEKKAQFYWLDHLERTSTKQMYNQDKLVLIEESYLYNDIPCTLYIINPSTIIRGTFDDYAFSNNIELKNLNLHVYKSDSSINYQFSFYYMYNLVIGSLDSTINETIISNLTNN